MKNVVCFSFLFLTFLLSKSAAFGAVSAASGIVQRCHDGDTCDVEIKNILYKIRFSGIDAPEINQNHGKDARSFTENLLVHQKVQLKCNGESYERQTCALSLQGQDVSAQIVAAGWAFDYPRFSKGKYKDLSLKAQKKHLGIWDDPEVISPFCFRFARARACVDNKVFMP